MAILYFLAGLALSFFVFYYLESPYIPMIMLLPVFISTSIFGEKYGYATAFASAIAIYFFFCWPLNHFVVKDGQAVIRVVTFLLLAVVSIIFIAKKIAIDDATLESEKHFRHLADNAPSLIWMADTDKLCYYFNTTWLEFTGRTMEQEMGNGWAQGVHPEDLQRCFDIYTDSFDARESFSMEYRLRCHDGSYRWILDNGVPRFDESGTFLGYIGSCADITNIKEFTERIEIERELKQKAEEALSVAVDAEEEAQALNEQLEATNEELEASFATIETERNKIQAIVDELPHIIIIKDKDFRYTFVNKALCTFLNKKESDVLGKTIFDFLAEDEARLIWEKEQDILENHKEQTAEETITDASGISRTLLSTKKPIMAEDGEIGLLVVITDITERKDMETALENSEKKFRSMFESSYDAIMLSDEDRFIDCNQRALELFGIADKSELMTYGPANMSPPIQANGEDSASLAAKKINAAIEKGNNHFEWLSMRRNGEIFPSDVLLSSFKYGDKIIIQSTVRDISDKYEARRISALLQKFFDNTSEGMTIADPTGHIVSVNPAFTSITGYLPQEVIGKNPRFLQSGEHSQKFYEKMWQDVLEKGRWEGEIRNKRKNGETYPEWITMTSIRNENGEIEYFVAVFLDLTQIKEAQHRLDEQERMIFAQSRFAAMGEMIGMIAHQWRQPITAIGMGANNMIMDIELGDINAQIFKKHLEQISTQVQFLSATIDDFRNFFRPNREMSEVNIDSIVEGALKIIGKSLENNNIEVRKQTAYNPIVKAYESELVQMLMAIISNAKDAIMERSIKSAEITISTMQNPDFPGFVELQICDNGGGIPVEIIDRIFEPYFTTKSTKNGTGLGLYIAKTIIEKHQNGSVGVKNKEDGACFWIRLPVEEQDI